MNRHSKKETLNVPLSNTHKMGKEELKAYMHHKKSAHVHRSKKEYDRKKNHEKQRQQELDY